MKEIILKESATLAALQAQLQEPDCCYILKHEQRTFANDAKHPLLFPQNCRIVFDGGICAGWKSHINHHS